MPKRRILILLPFMLMLSLFGCDRRFWGLYDGVDAQASKAVQDAIDAAIDAASVDFVSVMNALNDGRLDQAGPYFEDGFDGVVRRLEHMASDGDAGRYAESVFRGLSYGILSVNGSETELVFHVEFTHPDLFRVSATSEAVEHVTESVPFEVYMTMRYDDASGLWRIALSHDVVSALTGRAIVDYDSWEGSGSSCG